MDELSSTPWRLRGVKGGSKFRVDPSASRLRNVRASADRTAVSSSTESVTRNSRANAKQVSRVPKRRSKRRGKRRRRNSQSIGVSAKTAAKLWHATVGDDAMQELRRLSSGPLLRMENIGTRLHRKLVANIFDVRVLSIRLRVVLCAKRLVSLVLAAAEASSSVAVGGRSRVAGGVENVEGSADAAGQGTTSLPRWRGCSGGKNRNDEPCQSQDPRCRNRQAHISPRQPAPASSAARP